MPHIEQFLQRQFAYLRWCGVQQQATTISDVRLVYSFIALILYNVGQPVGIVLNMDNFQVVCDIIPPALVAMIGTAKFYHFVFHRRKFLELVDGFKQLQERATPDEFRLFVDCSHIHRKLSNIYAMSAMMGGLFYILNAIVDSVRMSWATGVVQLVYPVYFPHSERQPPLLSAVVFIFISDTMYITIFTGSSVDTLFSELASNICIHFRILQHRFQSMNLAERSNPLRETVDYHCATLELSLQLTKTFETTIFYLLLFDSSLLCVVGYQFVLFLNQPRVLIMILMAFVMTLQAVIYTYHGSVLLDESVKVADAIYQSNWYEATEAERQQLRFCIARAQQPIQTRGGFIMATLPTLKTILSSTGSYITMLLSFSAE